MAIIFIFLVGLAVGSFLNVLIWRLPRNENFVRGRSRCVFCRHPLSWQEIIPLASFIFLKRRCRHCGKKISWRYFGVELLTGTTFLSFWKFSQLPVTSYQLPVTLSILALLIVLVVVDFDYYVIPDKILVVLGGLGLLRLFVLSRSLILISITTAAVVGLVFFLIYLLANIYYEGGGMGLGDVKLAALLGFLFGFPAILPVIYLALTASLLTGLTWLLFFKGSLKTKLPFGSFLGGAAIVYTLFNQFFLSSLMPYIFRLYI